jgi:hypothetical protein
MNILMFVYSSSFLNSLYEISNYYLKFAKFITSRNTIESASKKSMNGRKSAVLLMVPSL